MKDTWRIDRLILQGFKSFAERTALDFPDPITGIIGPNGSGKSNLVEALRFVTGARAHELRGQELGTLLFHGGEGRPPQAMAEVRLELSRGRERLTVERRIEGDRSLFRVNGRPLSAKALALHLAGTGLGRGGYAIVGQGEVAALLEAPGEVLLAHLEEAAGLKPVVEAARVAEKELEEAHRLLEERERELQELKAQVERLRGEAHRAKRAQTLDLEALALRVSLVEARMEEAQAEMARAEERLKALAREEETLERERQALEKKRLTLAREEESLRQELEAVRLLLKEREGFERELKELARLHKALDRPPPEDPGPPIPPPPRPLEELRTQLRHLKAEEARLLAAKKRHEEAFRRYLTETARYEERLKAYQEALAERAHLEEELAQRLEELRDLEGKMAERKRLETHLTDLRAQAQGALRETERLRRLLEAGSDLHEGPRRVRKLPGVLGVVADLVRPEAGLELALEVALGPRLQWVLTQDEEAAKAAIALLKREGGRATFLPLTLLSPPPPPSPPPAPGLLGPAFRLARLRHPGLPEEKILLALLGDTLVFADLDAALAYRRALGRERVVTLEGEVLERLGALSGGRLKGGGETLLLRRRLEDLETEQDQLAGEIKALEEALASLPPYRRLEEARAQVGALQARLRSPLPPPPQPPTPPQETWEEARLLALEKEREELEGILAQAEAHERWRLLSQAREAWAASQEEVRRIQARMEELKAKLAATQPLLAKAQELEERLKAVRAERTNLEDQQTRALTRANALLSERENLRLLLARREALLEELGRERASFPPLDRLPGTPRALQARLAQVERERASLGPVNALAERELMELEARLEAQAKEVQEATEALLRLEAEAKAVEKAYGERLKESYQVFQSAFQKYALALLGARAEVRREGQGLKLVVIPAGKRTQDLRLLSLGEKTLGALAFLFSLGELQGGLPLAVLDEVDAALDEANLVRFTRFLNSGKQFILVTHQKRTMEACHALYGVTAQGGVSRVFSIRKEAAHDPK
ncbi:AAA family ATPase [Thermus tenuipuniceus]|uniref:AAA family ATPase n=1 Tax=Thermus tenuipuniceus TaxID=2078690 RepID=UPI000CFA23D4|nr:chromosome segregation SMC family protein [Thermus tenuipuniceus]